MGIIIYVETKIRNEWRLITMTTTIKTLDEYMEIGKSGVETIRTVKFGGKEFSKRKDRKI